MKKRNFSKPILSVPLVKKLPSKKNTSFENQPPRVNQPSIYIEDRVLLQDRVISSVKSGKKVSVFTKQDYLLPHLIIPMVNELLASQKVAISAIEIASNKVFDLLQNGQELKLNKNRYRIQIERLTRKNIAVSSNVVQILEEACSNKTQGNIVVKLHVYRMGDVCFLVYDYPLNKKSTSFVILKDYLSNSVIFKGEKLAQSINKKKEQARKIQSLSLNIENLQAKIAKIGKKDVQVSRNHILQELKRDESAEIKQEINSLFSLIETQSQAIKSLENKTNFELDSLEYNDNAKLISQLRLMICKLSSIRSKNQVKADLFENSKIQINRMEEFTEKFDAYNSLLAELGQYTKDSYRRSQVFANINSKLSTVSMSQCRDKDISYNKIVTLEDSSCQTWHRLTLNKKKLIDLNNENNSLNQILGNYYLICRGIFLSDNSDREKLKTLIDKDTKLINQEKIKNLEKTLLLWTDKYAKLTEEAK